VVKELPQFTHDCGECRFLGRYHYGSRNYDLYFCGQGGLPIVLARYGSNGPYYDSGLSLHVNKIGSLGEARIRAIKKGFIS